MRLKICNLPLLITLAVVLAGCAQTNNVFDDVKKAFTPQQSQNKPLPRLDPGSYYSQAWQLNMRQCPGVQCHIISVLKRGQEVEAGEQRGGWIKVTPANSQNTGWVAVRYLGAERPKARAKRSDENIGPAPEPPPPQEELAPMDS